MPPVASYIPYQSRRPVRSFLPLRLPVLGQRCPIDALGKRRHCRVYAALLRGHRAATAVERRQ